MPKTKDQKKQIIEDLTDKLKEFKSLVFVDYKGLTVKDASEIKKLCKTQNVDYVVVKKTLIKLALEKAGIKDIEVKQLSGNIALVIGFEDEIAPAKIVGKFAKDHEALKMLGGIMESRFIDLNQVMALSKIPSKVELLAKLVGSINAPVSGFVNVLAGNLRGLVQVLNSIKEQKT
ncbi:MAG: 50S ribosomal protein L10 [Candidatus Parcubacteria bacterium]|nr:50S ribosomal protein L10 [Candidatus Parcubacteria bacterium]